MTIIKRILPTLLLVLGLATGQLAYANEPALAATGPVVNINTASAEELTEALTGVGPAKARAIVEYRDANGPFDTAAALQNVPGIGPSTMVRNEGRVTVE